MQIRYTFVTCLLFLVVSIAAAGDWKISPPSPVARGPHTLIDQRTEGLLEMLRSARRTEDRQEAEKVEQLLGWRDSVASDQVALSGPAERIIRPELSGVEQRWDTDILVSDPTLDVDFPDIDARDDGTLYIVCQDVEFRNTLDVYSSTNDGASWGYWFSLYGGDQDLSHPSIAVVDTGTPELLIAYEKAAGTVNSAIWVHGAYLDIPLSHNSLVDSYPGFMIYPRLCVDYPEYNTWYAYIVYATSIPGETDFWQIRFRRSIDYAESWSAAEVLATVYNSGDFGPLPDIDFGGTHLYAVYDVSDAGTGKRDIFVRTSDNFGAAWDPPTGLAGSTDDEYYPRVAATNGPTVAVVAYAREYTYPIVQSDIETYATSDTGATWSWGYLPYTEYDEWAVDLCVDRGYGRIHAAYGRIGDLIYTHSNYDNPNNWAAEEDINTGDYASHSSAPALTIDPSEEGSVRIAWSDFRDWTHYLIYFDSHSFGSATVTNQPATMNTLPRIIPTPNPLLEHASVRFVLPQSGTVCLSVMDLRGRRLRTLLDHSISEGVHDLTWDGRDPYGRALPSGIYFYELRTEQGNCRQRFTVVR